MSSVSAVNVQEHEQSYSNKSYNAARSFFYAKPLMLAQTDAEAPSDDQSPTTRVQSSSTSSARKPMIRNGAGS